MPLGMEVGLGPDHIVLDGDLSTPPKKGAQQPPTFQPMSVVAKRSPISATAQLLFTCVVGARSLLLCKLVLGLFSKFIF